MSELSNLVGAGRGDVISGYTLMPLRVAAFGELQRHFEATLLRTAAVAAAGQQAAVADRIMEAATEIITGGRLGYGSFEFYVACSSIDHLPYLLYQCLKEKHPKVTPAGAATLLKDDNLQGVLSACMEMAGYRRSKKKRGGAGGEPWDWRRIYQSLFARGHDWRSIGGLTAYQIRMELSGFSDEDAKEAQREADLQAAANVIFDRITARYEMEAEDWRRIGDDELVYRVCQAVGRPDQGPAGEIRESIEGYLMMMGRMARY